MLSAWSPERSQQGEAAVQEVCHLFFLFQGFVSLCSNIGAVSANRTKNH